MAGDNSVENQCSEWCDEHDCSDECHQNHDEMVFEKVINNEANVLHKEDKKEFDFNNYLPRAYHLTMGVTFLSGFIVGVFVNSFRLRH